jgi:leader peptidase (prepilin peptidase)/N-methyltransferase
VTADELWSVFILAWLFVLGSVFGSFLNVCVHRFPRHEFLGDQLRSIWSPPSHCPRCGAGILKRDNVPVVGWLLLRGRCRNCRLPISARYPLIELANGLLFALVYWLEVPQELGGRIVSSSAFCPVGPQIVPGGLSESALLHWRYAFHMVLFETLLVASLIDIDTTTIPDASTVPAMLAGLVMAAALGQVWLVPVWFIDPGLASLAPEWSQGWFGEMVRPPTIFTGPDPAGAGNLLVPAWALSHPHLHGLAVSVMGIVIGGGVVWLVRVIGRLALGREAMGFGDVVLMATVGAFLGWQATLVAFFFAPFCALLFVVLRALFRHGEFIPYGPYLSASTLVLVLGWREAWPMVGHWYSTGPLVVLAGGVLLLLMFPTLVATRWIKRALGFPDPPPESEWVAEWGPADQLQYLAGEVVERDRQQWTRPAEWPGTSSANGTLHEERWRGTNGPTGWPE